MFLPWCADPALAADLFPEETRIETRTSGGKKAHQGVAPQNLALHQGVAWSNSTNALGLRTLAVENGIRSRCTGKERDVETGLDYFGARYYGSNLGRFMKPDPLPWIHWQRGNEDDEKRFDAYIANPQNFNMYAYVLNNPLNKTDPTGEATCTNPPSCTTSTIDTHPAGANGPTITFKNDDPNGKSPNQPVTTKTAVMVEKAVIGSGVKSVNINSTTGGKHGQSSNHAKGRAVDINMVNGASVKSQGASPAVQSLQSAFAGSPDIRENFGPSRMEKTSTPGSAAQPFGNSQLAKDHEGHIHESSQP